MIEKSKYVFNEHVGCCMKLTTSQNFSLIN